MNKYTLRNIFPLIISSIVLAFAIYMINIWLFSSSANFTFWEGIIFIVFGVLFILGSGGITQTSKQAALFAAAAEAIYDEEIIGPSEIYRRDAWKPEGLVRIGLILIMAGAILLLIYFISR